MNMVLYKQHLWYVLCRYSIFGWMYSIFLILYREAFEVQIRYSTESTVLYRTIFLFTLIHRLQRIMWIEWIMVGLWQYGLVRSLYGTVPQYSTLRYGTVVWAVSRHKSTLFLWIWNEATLTLSSIWGHKYLVLMCLVLLKNANYLCCCISHLKCVIDMT